jgi:hypothetical protein
MRKLIIPLLMACSVSNVNAADQLETGFGKTGIKKNAIFSVIDTGCNWMYLDAITF